MNKITVLKSDDYNCNLFWDFCYNNGNLIAKDAYKKGMQVVVAANSVEITDEEIVNASREYAKLQFPYPEQVGQRAHIRDAYMAAYEFIKSRINSQS